MATDNQKEFDEFTNNLLEQLVAIKKADVVKHNKRKFSKDDSVTHIANFIEGIKSNTKVSIEKKYVAIANVLMNYYNLIQLSKSPESNFSKILANTLIKIQEKISDKGLKLIIIDLVGKIEPLKKPNPARNSLNPTIIKNANAGTSLFPTNPEPKKTEKPVEDHSTIKMNIKEDKFKNYKNKKIDKYLEKIAGDNKEKSELAGYDLMTILKGKDGLPATLYLLADKKRIDNLSAGSWANVAKISLYHAHAVLKSAEVIDKLSHAKGGASGWLRNIGESNWKTAELILKNDVTKNLLNKDDKQLLEAVVKIDSQHKSRPSV